MRPTYLMSPPRLDWSVEGKANFRSRQADRVDPGRARMEWCTLADAIVDAGGEVLVCPPNPKRKLTGMVYTAEAGEYYRTDEGEGRFILPNMKPKHRRREADWIGGFVEGLGIPTESVESTWEAQGDAIRGRDADEIVFTYGEGADARSDRNACEEVARRIDADSICLQFNADPWFHGNTFLNIYRALNPDRDPPGVALVCPEALPDDQYAKLAEFLDDFEIVEISRRESLAYDTNSLQVTDTVLAPAQLSETASRAFRRLGLKVVTIALGELFDKGGGAPVCLTNRLWGLDPDQLPDHAKWSHASHVEAHTGM